MSENPANYEMPEGFDKDLLGNYPPLMFTHEHLESITFNIPLWNIHDQSMYADGVTRNLIDSKRDEELYNDYTSFGSSTSQIEAFYHNSTSIGNAAYVVLHSDHKPLVQECQDYLDKVKAMAITLKRIKIIMDIVFSIIFILLIAYFFLN